ncbi:oligosaccharide flippase family protein [Picrophilus oshimae]|uniref:Hypothetical membrane protein n=1 Tax=Picrophilus torridus (strain ATCC 700027 / DSM 9790 / JCM 10055 / NBRC 100828 / KAW 2/3) TaxID=1122961 RepID=Q6L0D2_PICTO|nr:oligosaccharide flippase family protein [Picrophilus oshimae]AAT43570.1 hypothetical membrane protein [Picrophilus oshimae DSM 9789]SMD31194.1 Membrane protein involved in the export of O-antigen and teichoic acid [Picrophilus oshimae DSM 9789]
MIVFLFTSLLISKKSPIVVSEQLINSLMGYAGLFFVIRFIGLQEWGFLSFGLAFVGLFSIVTDLGYGTVFIREISGNNSEKEEKVLNGTFLLIKIVLSFIAVLLVLLSLYVWVDLLHHGFQSKIELYAILILIPYLFFNRVNDFTRNYYQAKMKSARMALPRMLEAIIRNSIFIILGIFYAFRIPGYNNVNGAIVLSAAYSLSYLVYFMISYILGRPWNIGRPSMSIFKKYSRIAYPLALSGIIGTVSANIDKVLIQFYWHAVATGAFYSMQVFTKPIMSFSGAISFLFIPMLMKTRSEDHRSSILGFERTISLFILPFVIALIGLRVYFVNLVSASLIPYSDVLIFLVLAAYLNVINMPYNSGLIAKNHTKTIGFLTATGITINIVLDLILIPRSIFGYRYLSLGVLGGGVSTFVAAAYEAIGYRIALGRHGVTQDFAIFKQIVPAMVQLLFIYMVLLFIKPYDILVFIPFSLASVIIFLGISIIIKEITLYQIIDFIKALNPFSIKKTMYNE